MRRRLIAPVVAGLIALLAPSLIAAPAAAKLVIQIDKNAQQMTVSQDGRFLHRWPVSTGVARYDTPGGTYRPFRMEKDHFSREWDDAPMPYSIFFTKKGHAIHGTTHKSLGRPASHGCVRLSVKNAATLWGLVKKAKMANTEVVLFGRLPEAAPVVAGNGRERNVAAAPPSYRRRWSNGPVYYQDNTGRRYYDNRPPPPPADLPPRRYYYDGYYDRPPPFPFFLFGR